MKTIEVRSVQVITVVIACAVLFGACAPANAPATQLQAPNTTLLGTLIKTGNSFAIQTAGKPIAPIDSYTQKFDAYVGQKVSVTGQYSGTTLFVDTLTVVK